MEVDKQNGAEKWILVHIEVQGENESHFPKRMFQYFYRIYDKYDKEIVAFAVITDPKESEKPTTFNYAYYGTTLDYAYNLFKVKDYDAQQLEMSIRLFSKVMLAAKYLNETKGDEEKRLKFKVKLMREIVKIKDEPGTSILAVMYFIDYLLKLPEELSKRAIKEMEPSLKKEAKPMGEIEMWDLPPTLAGAFKLTRKEAIEEGLEQGLEQGIIEGARKEKEEMVPRLLKKGMEISMIAELPELDIEIVKEIKRQLS